ncbi:AAA family ATPase [Enorma phocaeensis]|uniref:AAA family ATPase n=1 Tax=Enorma phocaeensis TaxID=1871019 RepID=UPI000C84F188|nr:AAA family ATPase [Enorma phocaeensis]
MRFRSITIENYRQYRNLTLSFSPGEHDLQVIVADNGVGKTNLLNAFTWCLYDEEPHLGNSGKQASGQRIEPRLNKEVIQECADRGGDTAIVRVSIDLEYERDRKRCALRVTRSVPFKVDKDAGYFEVKYDKRFSIAWIDGEDRLPLWSDAASEYLDKLLPQSIREYFFFDGEQLDSYFKATGGERIKEAVYSISQIDLFHTMIERLDKIIRSQRTKASVCSVDTKKYEQILTEAEQLANGCEKFIKRKEAEIEQLDQQLSEIGDRLRGVDDVRDIEKKRELAERQRDAARSRLERTRSEFYSFVRNRVIDFYLYPVASGALASIRALEGAGQLPPAIDPVKLAESLKTGRCVVCRHELDGEERAHIEELLEQYRVGSETSNILSSMRSELGRTIVAIENYPSERNRRISDLKDAAKALDSAEDELRDIEKLEGKYADTKDGIKKLYEDRSLFQRQRDECFELIGTRRNNLKNAQTKIEKYEKLLNQAMQKNAEASEIKAIIDFGQRALRVLKDAEADVIRETKENMEQRTEELFKGLVWKESKCDRIELSQNYTPSLYDRAGFSCAGTCSAAERSLLALSFTLAMHEVSGFDSPLFIDTPIARASGENRENFARTLVEVSKGKQLILAFTPDEYSESISNEFGPATATYIRLRLDASESHVAEPEVIVHGK